MNFVDHCCFSVPCFLVCFPVFYWAAPVVRPPYVEPPLSVVVLGSQCYTGAVTSQANKQCLMVMGGCNCCQMICVPANNFKCWCQQPWASAGGERASSYLFACLIIIVIIAIIISTAPCPLQDESHSHRLPIASIPLHPNPLFSMFLNFLVLSLRILSLDSCSGVPHVVSSVPLVIYHPFLFNWFI